jgi:hypothetical protein
MLTASNIQYEMGDRLRGTAVGGIGAMHLLARRTGLIETLDGHVQVLKRHLPYHESHNPGNTIESSASRILELSAASLDSPSTRDSTRAILRRVSVFDIPAYAIRTSTASRVPILPSPSTAISSTPSPDSNKRFKKGIATGSLM